LRRGLRVGSERQAHRHRLGEHDVMRREFIDGTADGEAIGQHGGRAGITFGDADRGVGRQRAGRDHHTRAVGSFERAAGGADHGAGLGGRRRRLAAAAASGQQRQQQGRGAAAPACFEMGHGLASLWLQ
jgi:hypothetical protein